MTDFLRGFLKMGKRKITELVSGLSIKQEYLCLSNGPIQNPLRIVLLSTNRDVTIEHVFLGYKPLVVAIAGDELKEASAQQIVLSFELEFKKFELARLSLTKIKEQRVGSKRILFLQGSKGVHHFISPFHQLTHRLFESLKKRKTENINLPGNLYDQVRIAYSVPRIISIITVGDGEKINLFPTDLHGALSDSYYAISLRIGGMANQQVLDFKKIALSTVQSKWFKEAYSLGKNHMQPLRDKVNFPIHPIYKSERFELPLPESITKYKELLLEESFELGIHTIHIFKIVTEKVIITESDSLSHIHQYYAQWRQNHGLITDYLLR